MDADLTYYTWSVGCMNVLHVCDTWSVGCMEALLYCLFLQVFVDNGKDNVLWSMMFLALGAAQLLTNIVQVVFHMGH